MERIERIRKAVRRAERVQAGDMAWMIAAGIEAALGDSRHYGAPGVDTEDATVLPCRNGNEEGT